MSVASGLLRLVFAAVIAASAVAPAARAVAAPAVRADDLAARRALVAMLFAIVPYSDADSERTRVEGGLAALRETYPGMSTYAEEQGREVIRDLWRKHPSMRAAIIEGLETRLTADELREAIAFTNSPQARKVRANPKLPGEADAARFERALNAEEQAEFLRLVQAPGFQKYLAAIQDAVTPIAQAVADDLPGALAARCPTAREPLPWC